jgi:hypothetical protein
MAPSGKAVKDACSARAAEGGREAILDSLSARRVLLGVPTMTDCAYLRV